MINLWNSLLFHPLLNALIFLAKSTGNLGLAIIALTVGLRLIMTPLVMPSLKTQKKMQELAPELDALKKKYKDDKQGLITAQAELYKKNGLNPAAGCLPQIVQIVVLIALFSAFNTILKPTEAGIVHQLNPILYEGNKLAEDFQLSTKFLYMDLTKPDVFHISGLPIPLPGLFLILSAVVQLLSSKMLMPSVKKLEKVAEKTEEKTDDMMAQTQEQMLYMFPVMTIIFGFQFPAGLVLYWFVFSLVSSVQQYYAVGWGGLKPWLLKLNLLKS